MAVQEIPLKVFLRHVEERHREQPERPFCFILGSGASVESGIPTGAELVDRWLVALCADATDGGIMVEEWATETTLGIPGFTYERRAEFYGEIYEKKFRGMWDAGFRELETTFAGREPSFGYSALAWILANTQHKVVITPNFDNLVADALFIYSETAPILCVHESLAGYVTHRLARPLVVKFHRDLLFDPKSRQSQINTLASELCEPLTNLFRNFTPIFIGYGGNDRGFMEFLDKLPEGVPDRIYWCIRQGAPPSDTVRQLLGKRDAFLVSTLGFDRLMLRLREPFAIPDLVGDVEKRHATRMECYRGKLADLLRETQQRSQATDATPEEVATTTAATTAARETKTENTPQSYILRARAEANVEQAEAIYREGLAKHSGDGDLLSALGVFLADKSQRFDEAEDLIRSAYEQDPQNPARLHDFGVFLRACRRDNGRAEPLLRQAVEKRTAQLGAEHPETLSSRSNLAAALQAQGKHFEAELENRTVLKVRERVLGSEHPATLSSRNSLALALEAQGRRDEAEQEYRTVLAVRERVLGAEHPDTLSSRSILADRMWSKGNFSDAVQELRAVLKIRERVQGLDHPDLFPTCYNLSVFLSTPGGNLEEALELAKRAAEGWKRVLGADHPDTKAALRNRESTEIMLRNQRARGDAADTPRTGAPPR